MRGRSRSSNLARYKAVVFLSTTGDVLTGPQQTAFERFIRAGGGFVGVHAAADTEYNWAWYGRLLGTRFASHPHIQRASIAVTDRRHPSTAVAPRAWTRVDEWYNFASNPRPFGAGPGDARRDDATFPGDGAMGSDHPIAWSHAYQGGRAWYTGGGHTDESYAEPMFRAHLLGGIRYAAGLSPPRIVSVTSAVSRRRLAVVVRYRTCQPCTGSPEIDRGRRSSTPIRFTGSRRASAECATATRRWAFSVVLTDPRTRLSHERRGSVRVR